jgi:hypothetical protein
VSDKPKTVEKIKELDSSNEGLSSFKSDDKNESEK